MKVDDNEDTSFGNAFPLQRLGPWPFRFSFLRLFASGSYLAICYFVYSHHGGKYLKKCIYFSCECEEPLEHPKS